MSKKNRNIFDNLDDFIEAIKAYAEKDITPRYNNFILKNTPEILQKIGYDNLEIYLSKYVVDKALKGKHRGEFVLFKYKDLNEEKRPSKAETFCNVIKSIADPLFIFKSKKKNISKVVCSEFLNESKELLSIIININDVNIYDGNRNQHIISSIHKRAIIAEDGTDLINKQIKNGYCEYINDLKLKEITSQSHSVPQVLMPALLPIPLTDTNNIKLKSQIVKKQKQEQKKSPEIKKTKKRKLHI